MIAEGEAKGYSIGKLYLSLISSDNIKKESSFYVSQAFTRVPTAGTQSPITQQLSRVIRCGMLIMTASKFSNSIVFMRNVRRPCDILICLLKCLVSP